MYFLTADDMSTAIIIIILIQWVRYSERMIRAVTSVTFVGDNHTFPRHEWCRVQKGIKKANEADAFIRQMRSSWTDEEDIERICKQRRVEAERRIAICNWDVASGK